MKLAKLADDSLAVGAEVDGKLMLVDVAKSLAALEPADRQTLESAVGADAKGGWEPLIDDWDRAKAALERLVLAATQGDDRVVLHDPEAVTLLAPLPSRNVRIFAMGGNFGRHIIDASKAVFGDDGKSDAEALEARRQQGPWGFLILPDTVIGPGADVRPPQGLTKIDYEGEVAVVLAVGGRGLSTSDVRVWGFTAWNDFSLRDSNLGVGPVFDGGRIMNWSLQKNFDTGSSCGPWLVVDEPFDIDDLRITLSVNDESRQDGRTSEMIFSFREAAEHVSHFLTLKSGDMIASGTPSGTAVESGIDGPYLIDGDVTELEVEGVGRLTNRVVVA